MILITILNGFVNQLVAGGPHIVGFGLNYGNIDLGKYRDATND